MWHQKHNEQIDDWFWLIHFNCKSYISNVIVNLFDCIYLHWSILAHLQNLHFGWLKKYIYIQVALYLMKNWISLMLQFSHTIWPRRFKKIKEFIETWLSRFVLRCFLFFFMYELHLYLKNTCRMYVYLL